MEDRFEEAIFLDDDLFLEVFASLTDEQVGELVRAMLLCSRTGAPPNMTETVSRVFCRVMPIVMEDTAMMRRRIRERREQIKGRYYPEYKAWRRDVFERDSYTCQYCGQIGGKLNAHHIKPYAYYPDLRTDLDNGITLCVKCHRAVHRRRR